jgi:hypothetical protein
MDETLASLVYDCFYEYQTVRSPRWPSSREFSPGQSTSPIAQSSSMSIPLTSMRKARSTSLQEMSRTPRTGQQLGDGASPLAPSCSS